MTYIAIDYDDTFTANPPFWRAVIALAHASGVTPIIVSCRDRTEEDIRDIAAATGLGRGRIYLTSRVAKKFYMEMLGIQVAWWCDDNPAAIADGV